MFTSILISVVFIIIGILFFYQHTFLFLLLYRGKNYNHKVNNTTNTIKSNHHGIDIFIPSHNEGDTVIHAVKSLIIQNYKHTKHIWVLLEDEKDSSYEGLKHFLSQYKYTIQGNTLEYIYNIKCKISIVFTGYTQKKDKLNYALTYCVGGNYVGFLDADHDAYEDRVSECVSFLEKNHHFIGVQAKRKPIVINTLFQLWDSNENHSLNELYNYSMQKNNRQIFFTGTTAIFRREHIKNYSFSNCLTEDTFLSYEYITKKQRLGYISTTGSKEHVAPDIISFIARRRRWANGHTYTFFTYLGSILQGSIEGGHKIQLFHHGLFYIITLIIYVFITALGLFVFIQIPLYHMGIVIGSSVIISGIWSLLYNQKIKKILLDTMRSFLWIFPHVCLLYSYLSFLFDQDLFFYLLIFPYIDNVLGFCIVYLFLLPLIVTLWSWLRIKTFSIWQKIILIITYPFSLFVSLYATFMGIGDYLFSYTGWKPIKRGTIYKASYNFKKYKHLYVAASIALFIMTIGFLYTSMPSICYREKIEHSGFIKTAIHSGEKTMITYTGYLHQNNTIGQKIYLFDQNGNILQTDLLQSGGYYTINETIEGGFNTIQRKVKIGNCQKRYMFTNTNIILQDKTILVNGEPFIIKGIIPSFAQGGVNMDLTKGYEQLKHIGANLVRFYHKPTDNSIDVLQNVGLLFLPQPNKSTWDNVQIDQKYQSRLLEKRFQNLNKDIRANPYIFALNIGNELEFSNSESPEKIMPYISAFATKIKTNNYASSLLTYASYFIFPYDNLDFFSVNMLDSGLTYWRDVLKILQSYNKPFLATELGGFVAFYEDTPELLRAYRLKDQWDILLQNNAMGGIIFQSHDNWAQPLLGRINDPLNNEEPDDNRGIRTRNNQKKASAYVVEDMFRDITITGSVIDIFNNQNIILHISNKRPYSLSNITIHDEYNTIIQSGINLPVGGNGKILLDYEKIKILSGQIYISYITHHGLLSKQTISLPSLNTPYIIGEGWIPVFSSPSGKLEGGYILSSGLQIYIPPTMQLKCGNKIYNNYYSSSGDSPIINSNISFSIDNGKNRIPQENRDTKNHNTSFIIKVGFNNYLMQGDILLLDGVGVNTIKIGANIDYLEESEPINVHNYRENIIKIDKYINTNKIKDFYIAVGNRDQSKYFLADNQKQITPIDIKLGSPRIFRPGYCTFISTSL